MAEKIYDVIIIGGGPGGYSAALYCARACMSTLVLEKLSAGGQMATTSQVDNYPGFEDGVDGFDLGEKMKLSAERFGAETVLGEVRFLQLNGSIKTVVSSEGTFKSKTVIVATGASPRQMGVEGEEGLIGRGVAYCATCDGMFYKDRNVLVVGGGNSAVADALFLSKICKSVTIVHRRDSLRATKTYLKPLERAENIKILWDSKISHIDYGEVVNGAEIENIKTGIKSYLPCDGIFVAVGRIPNTDLVNGQIDLDPQGYIVADESTKTNLPGVYAVGDVRTKALRQIITAAADGATASKYIEDYLVTFE
ncbi:thioredoxin-disulfide reductase [Eubacterium aggregans]|uniref:thioredoxin-disulfide reductase n=1 Tax=Eubacterium aggregans TaxID=81409 RepID=UPI0023F1D989|nr:thioredoxin-disulfide reductase [Eubacterium aggregans]MDD4692489.1 thioredoxin-disulfide reductase [Eubacterium aggregans]